MHSNLPPSLLQHTTGNIILLQEQSEEAKLRIVLFASPFVGHPQNLETTNKQCSPCDNFFLVHSSAACV
jgi:hypothetical protein